MTMEQSLAAFTIAAALLTITPGLDTALVLRAATDQGRRAALFAGAGICLGCLAWGALVAAGLGALIEASPLAYSMLKAAGAAYLIYLGIKLIMTSAGAPRTAGAVAGAGQSAWFRRGLLTNLLNPKVGVFYTAFLPQFVPGEANVALFTLLLALIHAMLGMLWFLLLAQMTVPIGRYLRSPKLSRWLDRALGGLLLLVAARMIQTART